MEIKQGDDLLKEVFKYDELGQRVFEKRIFRIPNVGQKFLKQGIPMILGEGYKRSAIPTKPQ